MRKTTFKFAVIDHSGSIKGKKVIKAKFPIGGSPDDIMTKGGKLYAVWNPYTGEWIENDNGDAIDFIVGELDKQVDEVANEFKAMGVEVIVRYMWDPDSHVMDDFLKYIERHTAPNRFHQLNQKIVSADAKTKLRDYISMKLPYVIAPGDCSAYDKIMDWNWEKEERQKLEWFIGGVFTGDMRHIQKFLVLHGDSGAGKSTWIKMVEDMLTVSESPKRTYVVATNMKKMGETNNDFSLESFSKFPLVAIQHDGDLSKIEDNTLINQIVSHETIEINEKHLKKYQARIHALLIMGSNRPVKITEIRSGIIRRLVDATPASRKKMDADEFAKLEERVKYEYGAIAYKCIQVFKTLGSHKYDNYIPTRMLAATNDFYDFMVGRYDEYAEHDSVTLDEVWTAWKEYCQFAGVPGTPNRKAMTAELGAYFRDYKERCIIDGVRVRKLYSGFRKEKFQRIGDQNYEGKQTVSGNSERDRGDSESSSTGNTGSSVTPDPVAHGSQGINDWLIFNEQPSIFDREYAEYPAQYETEYRGNLQPEKRWVNCKTKLKDLDTSKTHYVLGPSSLIFIDFDKKNAEGKKDFAINKAAAESLVPTYAELSKSGGGIHLYYIYQGDVSKLADKLGEDIEIKVCPEGKKSPIRRMLTKCNDVPIATISSGLPMKQVKGVKKMVSREGVKDEKHLRNIINQCLRREGSFGPHTSENVQRIKKALDEAYDKGIYYDVSDLERAVKLFANESTNQKDICLNMVRGLHFKSDIDEPPRETPPDDETPIILDVEIYRPDPDYTEDSDKNPGLFLICWKYLGAPASSIVKMFNPRPWEVEALFKYKIVGYNIREYDAHMLYGRAMGDGNARLYDRSYRIINLNDRSAKVKSADSLAWLDIYEIWKAAGQGMSLKKIEIMLSNLAAKTDEELHSMGMTEYQMKGINIFRGVAHHKEMGIPWDQPAPLDRWAEIADYCGNDVLATEAAYWFGYAYINARKIQVAIVKSLHPECDAQLIDTANTLTKRMIFGNNKKPQSVFNYRDLSKPIGSDRYEEYLQKFGPDYRFRVFNNEGLPEYRDYIPGEKLPDGWSIAPWFPGYTYDPYAKKDERSTFHGDHGGEGGRTFSLVGMWRNVLDLDITSQYPFSIKGEMLFGPVHTKTYMELVMARVAVKHKDFEKAGSMLNGALKPFLNEESAKDLAQALKIIINSVYGLTSAAFENEFRDPRNIDNIVAKRGNLFMLVLKEQIEARGYTVCHIKTDSIKIPDADEFIKNFAIEFGKEYGYNFEIEGEFDKFVLLNDAAYVAHDKNSGEWVTKAKQFQEPYVRKTLFTKEKVIFEDLIQTFSVTGESALYLDINESLPNVAEYEKEYETLKKKVDKETLQKGYSSLDEMKERMQELSEVIPTGHNYKFVGRVGSFVPIKPGMNGGILYRMKDGKYYAASGSSGYRWVESEDFSSKYSADDIDMSFYTTLAEQAKEDISQYGDFDWFVNAEVIDIPKKEPFVSVETLPLSDEPFMNIPIGADDELPWDE